jgi:hypothetical protein
VTVCYKSNDGLIFDDEFECALHELKLLLNYSTIEVLDKYDLPLDEVWTEDAYNKSQTVKIKSQSDLIALKALQDYCGFYNNIDSVGTYVWDSDDSDLGCGCWRKDNCKLV